MPLEARAKLSNDASRLVSWGSEKVAECLITWRAMCVGSISVFEDPESVASRPHEVTGGATA